jgi:hypothetical protein
LKSARPAQGGDPSESAQAGVIVFADEALTDLERIFEFNF